MSASNAVPVSSGQRFACGFLQILPHDRHPCRPANSSPCRVCGGLSPPSKCALPGAPIKKSPLGKSSRGFSMITGPEESLRHRALADPADNATWTDPPRCLAENSISGLCNLPRQVQRSTPAKILGGSAMNYGGSCVVWEKLPEE